MWLTDWLTDSFLGYLTNAFLVPEATQRQMRWDDGWQVTISKEAVSRYSPNICWSRVGATGWEQGNKIVALSVNNIWTLRKYKSLKYLTTYISL
jgi:hypothetical protein